jgi:hypothetical protein
MSISRSWIAVSLVVGCLSCSLQAAVIHDYLLNNSYADSLGGPALTPNGGTLSAGGYTFAATQGLNLDSALTANQALAYTIDLFFDITSAGKYNKLLDFKNRTTDSGLYFDPSNHLNFFPATSGSATIANGQNVQVTLSRDTLGTVTGFFNGAQQFQFSDTSLLGTFSAANNRIWFFQDEGFQGAPGEYPSGTVTRITISSSVDLPSSGVPEPSTGVLLAVGVMAIAAFKFRKS